jgi:predicted pyridoxine 5'-phosphate oxidase superfamily flavin-nucleotide-binding protein
MSGRGSPFHHGEKAIQAQLGVADRSEQLGRAMIRRFMPESHQRFFSALSLLLVGTTDAAGRPWASVLAGPPGFLRPIDPGVLRGQAQPIYGDPLTTGLAEDAYVGTLGMSFESRIRARLNGTIANVNAGGFEIRAQQSFGNCDQYIQTREPVLEPGLDAIGETRAVRRDEALRMTEAALVAGCDTFFIASQARGAGESSNGIDISHRGGRPGFVLVAHESLLLFPDYAGNRMFNTLGNLQVAPPGRSSVHRLRDR